ncbi:MAG: glycosyltransferase [Muribaculaceae bacterium]
MDETIKLIENCHINKFTFLIVGDGPDRDRLEKHIKKSSIKNNVIFTGLVPMDSVNAYYQLADLFICSSTSEAQGLTYFEALANGVPALCKKDACLDGVLINYKNGFQYTNEDDFAEFLNFFFSDKCNREDMIANALPVKDKFSSKAFGENVAELYKNTIKKFNEKNSVNYK